jgi:rubredoxin
MAYLMQPTCPTCGGFASRLGTLANRVWFRCINCGWEWAFSAEPGGCPKCGGRRIAPIAHGYPTPETEAAAARGEVVLGGCFPGPETHACLDCGYTFRPDE